jgi:phage virion morphogenesis protein
MSGLRISVEGDTRAIREGLQLLKRAGEDLRPAFEDIGEALVRSTAQRFENQVDPEGQPWAPLSPATLLFKQKKGYPAEILTMRGRLRASIAARPGATQVWIGTNVVYAAIHQFGGLIQKAAHSRQLRLRTDAKGNLLSQAQLGIGPKRMRNADQMRVFAKKSHKRAILKWAEVAAHEIQIPARPFLGLSRADQDETLKIIQKHLQAALAKLRA